MADDHICRYEFSVFPVWAATIMLAGCDCDTLGPKRARGGRMGKVEDRCMDFHSSMVTKVPELLPSTTAGQKGQCAAYKQDLCIL